MEILRLGSFPDLFGSDGGHYKHSSIASTYSYLLKERGKMRTLIVILIGLSIFFAGCGKRDVISGFPEKEAVKWRPGAGTVIAVGSAALFSVFAYIDSKSLFKRPAAVAEWCFCHQCTLLRRQGVQEAFRVYLLSEDGEAFDFRE
jgi:hypothetical protein